MIAIHSDMLSQDPDAWVAKFRAIHAIDVVLRVGASTSEANPPADAVDSELVVC